MRIEVPNNIETDLKMPVIHIGEGLLTRIPTLVDMRTYTKAVIVTDKEVPHDIKENVARAIPIPVSMLELPSGEQTKSLDTVMRIWQHLHARGCDRKSVVINVGGGIISDAGGFAAATFLRGIDWINVPTTLLAQADASIGGKTGINLGEVKNLVGVIKQPRAIIVDVDTLSSLPSRQLLSGFAEIIKHGIIGDPTYFSLVTSKKPNEFTKPELVDIIRQSINIKSGVVHRDPLDNGVRKTLNFGHTVGHAVEALSQKTVNPLTHGEAVAIGMAAETLLAQRIGLLSQKDKEQILAGLRHAGLPTRLPAISELKTKLTTDKKNINGQIRWILPVAIGKVISDVVISDATIDSVLKEAEAL